MCSSDRSTYTYIHVPYVYIPYVSDIQRSAVRPAIGRVTASPERTIGVGDATYSADKGKTSVEPRSAYALIEMGHEGGHSLEDLVFALDISAGPKARRFTCSSA